MNSFDSLPSMVLASQAHELFSNIKNRGYKKDNLVLLKELHEKMIFAGFDAPFKVLLNRTYTEAEEESEENIADIKKQINYFKQMAIIKKGALKRANIAIGAHYLYESFISMGYGDIAEKLALDGNYIDPLFKSGVFGIKNYRKLMESLEERAENIPVFFVELFFNGDKYKIRVNEKENIEEKVMQEFGPDAKVTKITSGKKKGSVIRSKSIRCCLIAAIISYVCAQEKDPKGIWKKSVALLLSPIFKFYLKNSLQERKRNNLYYSLAVSPEEKQAKIFNLLKEIEPEFSNAEKILNEKFEFEGKMQIQSKLIGAGILAKNIKKEKEWVAKYLGLTIEDVEKGIGYVEAFYKKGKGAKFLENLK